MSDTPSAIPVLEPIPTVSTSPNALPWRLLLPILLFGTYPLALLFGVGGSFSPGLVFHIALPSFALLTLAAVPYLLGAGYQGSGKWGGQLAKWLPLGLLAYLVVVALSAVLGRSVRVPEILAVVGAVFLPVFFAVAPRRFLPRRLAGMLAVLWGVNVLHALLQVAVKGDVVALAGNMNWAASLLVCLLPWVWVAAGGLPSPARWLAGVASTALTFWLVWLCHSRAVWLAVALYVAVYVALGKLPGKWRWLAVLLGVVLVAVAGFLARGKLAAKMAEDIRPPLYAGVLKMVAERPVLGFGPGNFRREYAGRRSRAHLARRVAADVTEHPHNELLRMAAELGVPATLAWVALIALAIFAVGPGARPVHRACHFSAFVLYAHGMLDKPLMMPPNSLLAVLFAGLLLRWRLPVRLVAASGGRLAVQGILAVLAIVLGSALTVSEVWRGALFRRATLAESAGLNETAYAAFAESAEVESWDVRTHAFAGICANNRLQKPELALPHLAKAWEMEPDYAHLNKEIGRAMSRLGRNQEALRFFLRETELFPFRLDGWRDLFVCGLKTGGMVDLARVQDEICNLRLQHVCRLLTTPEEPGEVAARRLAAAFALAAEGGEPGQEEEALALTKHLSADLNLPGVEGIKATGDPRQFDETDIRFWHVRMKWRNAWLRSRDDVPSLLAAWSNLPTDLQVVGFAEFAESAGWRTLVVQTIPEVVELQREDASFLVVPSNGKVLPQSRIEDLITQDQVRGQLGVRFPEHQVVQLVVGELRLYERTQYLGYALYRLLPTSMPRLYRSPYAVLYATQRRFEQAGVKVAISLNIVPE